MSGAEIVTLGETMALVAATGTGPFTVGAGARLSCGGAESNVAVGLSRLGHRAAWVGRLGADPFGSLVSDALRGAGVDVSAVVVDPQAPTGLMVRENRTADRVRVSYYRRDSAGSRLHPDDLPPDLVAGARVLHLSGITPALSPTAHAATLRAIELARESDVLVSFDLNYRAALWSRADAGAELRELVRRVDLVFAGDEEATLVVEEGEPPRLAEQLAELGPVEAVVKRGADGAVACVRGAVTEVPALTVSMVDPVGAGDAFVAGYLSGLLDGLPVEERLDRANRCGAFAVSVAGDWEGLPRRDELTMLGGQENVAR